MRGDVVLFEEPAPLYRTMWKTFDALTERDELVVIGTDGHVIEIGEVARMSRALTILNNLHRSALIDESAFDHVLRKPATVAAPEIPSLLDEWRSRL